MERFCSFLSGSFFPIFSKALSAYIDFGAFKEHGYVLGATKAGKTELLKAIVHHIIAYEMPKNPKRKVLAFNSDYFHRVRTVDFFVSLKLWENLQAHNLESFTYYFQQNSGSNRNNRGGQHLSDNKIDVEKDGVGYVVPDGIFMLRRDEQMPIFGLFFRFSAACTSTCLP